MIMAEETINDLSTSGSTTEQPLKVEAVQVVPESVDESSKATVTKFTPNIPMSKGSNNRSSQISDTESMDPDRGSDEEYDDDVEPDSIPSNLGTGSAFVSVPQSYSDLSTLKCSSVQRELSEACALSSESSMSKASASEPVKEPLTVVKQITEMHNRRRQAEEADFLKTINRISTLEQQMEMLSLQNKDLRQQVKVLKEDNNHLRSAPGGVLEDQNRRLVEQVNHLQENLRQAVERMYHYQSRCEKFELLQTERVHAGPGTVCAAGTCSSLPSIERSDEPDTMPCLRELSPYPPGPVHCSDDISREEEVEEEDDEEEEEEKKKKEDIDRK